MPPTKHSPNAIFLKNLTLHSWLYKFPFGRCSDGPLCLKPALQQEQDDGGVAVSASSCLGPLLFFCFWLFFLFVFAITNTKDPVEKTFCFTGNKKIIYASVKCKKKIDFPSSSCSQTRPLWSLQKQTQVTFVFLYTSAVRGMKGQSQQTEPNCFVPRFRCWWINGETDRQVCLCCSALPFSTCPRQRRQLPPEELSLPTCWCCSRCDLFVVISFVFVPLYVSLFFLATLKPPAEKHGFKPLFWGEKQTLWLPQKHKEFQLWERAQCLCSDACRSAVVVGGVVEVCRHFNRSRKGET